MNNKFFLIVIAVIIIALGANILWYFRNAPLLFQEKKSETNTTKKNIGVGIVAENEEITEKYRLITDYLNKKTDHSWFLVPAKSYGSLINDFEESRIEAGFMGSAVAYRMMSENLALPVARAQVNGISTYDSYIISRKDSNINKIEDLKDKKIAYVDIYTSAGYLFPIYLLKQKGYDPENFFKLSSFLGTHEKVINAVMNGEYDAGAAKNSAWKKLANDDPRVEKELQIIAQTGPFPEQTFMIAKDLGEEEVDELREVLINMNNSEEGQIYLSKFGAETFIPTETKDFDAVKKISEQR